MNQHIFLSLPTWQNIPNEILLQIFSYLPFQSIVSARTVCHLWRFLIPQAIKPLYRTVLSKYRSNGVPVHLARHYEFRTILLEWPDLLCWYANKVCPRCLLDSERCDCYHPEFVCDCDITLTRSVFSSIMNYQPIPMSDDNSFACGNFSIIHHEWQVNTVNNRLDA